MLLTIRATKHTRIIRLFHGRQTAAKNRQQCRACKGNPCFSRHKKKCG